MKWHLTHVAVVENLPDPNCRIGPEQFNAHVVAWIIACHPWRFGPILKNPPRIVRMDVN